MEAEKNKRSFSYPSAIKTWLIIGALMVFMQVVIGGITRLTGSGLSITKWEIITGTLPPLNQSAWEEAFSLYRETPQYQKINEGMSLGEFKVIYFWEYLHRLWARTMGFVFLIPFLFFWWKGWINRALMKRLLVVVGLAAVVAVFGWIMVASGLVDRPWVSAYKLTLHLSLALLVFGYLLWTIFYVFGLSRDRLEDSDLKKWSIALLVAVSVQIMLGGMMSGMHAALVYPTWPLMNGVLVPDLVFHLDNWTAVNFMDYEQHIFLPTLIQFLHRTMGYLVFGFGIWFGWRVWRRRPNGFFSKTGLLWMLLLALQVVLGIFTLVNSRGQIPVSLGVIHQAVALLVLFSILLITAQIRWEKKIS